MPTTTKLAEGVHALTTVEAVEAIRTAPPKTDFAMHARFNLAAPGDGLVEDYGHLGLCYVNLSRKEAMRIAGDMVAECHAEKGARIRFTVQVSRVKTVTYWLG